MPRKLDLNPLISKTASVSFFCTTLVLSLLRESYFIGQKVWLNSLNFLMENSDKPQNGVYSLSTWDTQYRTHKLVIIKIYLTFLWLFKSIGNTGSVDQFSGIFSNFSCSVWKKNMCTCIKKKRTNIFACMRACFLSCLKLVVIITRVVTIQVEQFVANIVSVARCIALLLHGWPFYTQQIFL